MPPVDLKDLPKEVQDIVTAIQHANRKDEEQIVNDILKDVKNRRQKLYDLVYVDLSIDRTISPQRVTGAGTIIAAIQATDNNANVSVSLERETTLTTERIELRRGKRLLLPYTEFYIYHAPQAGKYMLLLRATSLPSLRLGVEDDSGETSNSDLVTALGNAAAATVTKVNVTAASTVIKAANAARKRIGLCNPGATVVYITIGEAATTSKFPLLPNAYIWLNNTGEIRGITAAGAQDIHYFEE